MINYRECNIQDIINSGNIEKSLGRVLQMQNSLKSRGINAEIIDSTTVMTPSKIVDEMLDTLPSDTWNHNKSF